MTEIKYIDRSSFNDLKSRYWCFLLYPENLPDETEWKQFLIDSGAKGEVSPLHDKDTITEEEYNSKKSYYDERNLKVGDYKKPHYHCIICTNGPTTKNAIEKRICTPLNATNCFSLISVPGYHRYLYHDQELYSDKVEYNKKDLWKFGGFDIADYIDFSSTKTFEIKRYICRFITMNDITELTTVYNFFDCMNMVDELKILDHNYNFFKNYIDSIRYRKSDLIKLTYDIPDFETGNIKKVILDPKDLGVFIGVNN